MRVRALAFRILNQLRHDRRTLALMLVAPVFLLTLVYFILADTVPVVNVAVINAPAGFEDRLEEQNVRGLRYSESEARRALEQGEVIATISISGGKSTIEVDGSNPTKAKVALAALEQAKMSSMLSRPDLKSEVNYVYGQEDLPSFDNFGATLIGFIIFFFVFLVSGISFLQERTSGTLEKLLSTPVRRWEIVVGYVLGFGLFTILQSFLISWYCVYVLKVMMIGSFALILLITLLTAMIALTLGILASTLANNEFQMIQFIPLIIVPQVFFSGLFDLPAGMQVVGYAMPLYYIADALTAVMIKGSGFAVIAGDLGIILACSVLFIILNTLLLKKYRRI
ncbi:ABC-type multidrug transport system, permease component [Desulfitobacterium dehalogenans ATCC 51507]|uniref:ABC-type multidrug transport system, permease component n=1 Tax=Desulfitobacterium dehalogenans (strain ATCC 51507 / DSM 9161 / JW/IU-DC1) TaxID=756499 RepID=I4A7X9_DESDJ|nr:ABC transporter permease [Desulfitobacterium dehalogenans]AFM00064.1 ABC-type multidrug transport system, permease component [Desulfitobacterium dehalogenans ATCC 51507]